VSGKTSIETVGDLMPAGTLCPGFNEEESYLRSEGVTRNQAKAQAAREWCIPYADIRCRRVWVRIGDESDMEDHPMWVDAAPGEFWTECSKDEPGALPVWKVS